MSTAPSEVTHPLRRMLPHMLHVTENRETLKSLESVWDVLNLLGQLSGTTTEMGDTKSAFASLTASLLHNLALTTYNKRVQEIAAQAQVAIDILVRNLYERTADIGFLAMDDTLRDFAAAELAGGSPHRAEMVERLQSYVRLYSVYRDVILVSPSGQVLARLPDGPQVESIQDPLLDEVLASSAPYTEAAVRNDLFPGESRNLLYGTRVLHEDGTVLGALFLCFDFENETNRIFQGLCRDGDWSVITLLDDENRVIASSDPWQVAPGAVIAAPYGDGHLTRFAGASYLTARHAAQGFQGYMGPAGWSALVLVPLAMAFEQGGDDDDAEAAAGTDAALVRAILRNGTTFSPTLQAIPAQADAIQKELNRSVWNANVRQSAAQKVAVNAALNPAFSKVLLAEIVRTGTRMKEVFTRSINDLQTMTVRSQLDDCQFHAALAMNILDRNLYERANDCRWWALDPLLRGLLAATDAPEREAQLGARLAAINALYSVYDSLLLFDAAGVVLATSRPELAPLVGRQLDAGWCARALAVQDDSYVVSAFAATDLYGGRPTYIYSAPLHNDGGKASGGIAAVFDSAPQLEAVLSAGLPRSAGAFALFIDADDNVVASTDANRAAGHKAGLPAELRAAALEGGAAQLIALDGQVLAVGGRGSSGYREYRGTEGRAGQRLLALVCVPLCANDGQHDEVAVIEDAAFVAGTVRPASAAAAQDTIDIASFYVGSYLLGVPAAAVVEAIPFGGVVRLPNASDKLCGATIYQGSTMLLYDLHRALGVPARGKREDMLTVVLQGAGGRKFGILVERLGGIPVVPVADIAPVSNVFVGITPILASVVKSHGGPGGTALTLLAVEKIAEMLNQAA
ncbi:chemotaxis signal transduction protein [Pseudoduganella lurida]|uniref:Chemotaxis signal transduction protein n=1 Tax=Pseudoduganella lurida TaxID=1036180 RepID=A0A562RAU1_9BURK|nr:chemotaxis protein CheW [Pseudoduganella lurida]TWI66189.1 chemotaxis signal transduction protein [Pseudoduganella lurida]